jgi:response regulator RpfG family c-di-GMP phosphodiesterase
MEPSAEICEGFCTAICKRRVEMTLFQDTVGDPRAARARNADILAWYGAAGDVVLGNAHGYCTRKASLAVALAQIAQLEPAERHALYFAGLLHGIGAIGNAAYRKGELLSERQARMQSWDVPAQGARLCAAIAALPAETADLVRWQAESWDGTGYPDQLRWFGIPQGSQLLLVADTFLRAADPDEALNFFGMQAGRIFGPDGVRIFTMWYHISAGELEIIPPPVEALRDSDLNPGALLDAIADRIDAHNGVPGRSRRVGDLAVATAELMRLPEAQVRMLAIATRIYGSGELRTTGVEDEQFDALARLGIETRARNAVAAATLAESVESLREAAEIVRARAEWYDGTGKPHGLRNRDIPIASAILAAAIAHERVDRASRLDEAAGTQFDPTVVRAMMEAAKAIA